MIHRHDRAERNSGWGTREVRETHGEKTWQAGETKDNKHRDMTNLTGKGQKYRGDCKTAERDP